MRITVFWVALCIGIPTVLHAQLSVRTLSTTRHGKTLESGLKTHFDYYSDLTVEYRLRNLVVGVRGEGFGAPDIDSDYNRIRQRYAEYEWDWGRARVGNFYGIFGRALILRGFELPGYINEDLFRTHEQQRVIRDFDGAKLELTPGVFNFQLLAGSPGEPLRLHNEKRRNGDLAGGQASVALTDQTNIGASFLRHKTDIDLTKLSSFFLSWNADAVLQKIGAGALTFDLYGEYATGSRENNNGTPNDQSEPRALYLSANGTVRSFGFSVEYKDYKEFLTNISDPPPLILENSETLLNRATHVLDPRAEKGFQVEAFYSPFLLSRVVANFTRARNTWQGQNDLFIERYLAFEYLGSPIFLKAFIDSGRDELVSEIERFTTGVAPEYTLANGTTVGLDLQWQHVRRAVPPFFDNRIKNLFASIRVRDWNGLSLALNAERTTDPDYTDSSELFLNASVGWAPTHQVDLQLFVGKRRGGPACDHGYCIEVPSFNGTGLRLQTQF